VAIAATTIHTSVAGPCSAGTTLIRRLPWNTFLSLVAPLPPSKANMKSTDHAQHQYPCTSQPSRQRMVLVQGRRRRRAPRTSCRRTRTPCPSRSCCRGRRRPPAHGILHTRRKNKQWHLIRHIYLCPPDLSPLFLTTLNLERLEARLGCAHRSGAYRRASAWPQLGFVPVASFAPPTFT